MDVVRLAGAARRGVNHVVVLIYDLSTLDSTSKTMQAMDQVKRRVIYTNATAYVLVSVTR